MKFVLDVPALNLQGEIIKDYEMDNNGKRVLVGELSMRLLLGRIMTGSNQGEVMTAEDKVRCGALAQKIFMRKDPIQLSIDEMALIKKRVGEIGSISEVIIVGNFLEPRAEEGSDTHPVDVDKAQPIEPPSAV